MNKIQFKHIKREDGCFEYRLRAKNYNDFFDDCIFYGAIKVDQDLREDWNEYLHSKGLHYMGVGSEANALLYRIVIDFFREGGEVLMQYFNRKDILGWEAEKCEWRYAWEYTIAGQEYISKLKGSLELIQSEDYPDFFACIRQFGFRNPKEFLEDVNYFDKSLDNRYFYITALDQTQTSHFIKAYNSDVTNWSFIYTQDQEATKTYLQNKKKRPDLNSYFEKADLLMNLQMGEDEGYYDGLQIISKVDISAKIEAVTQKLNGFRDDYNTMIKSMKAYDGDTAIYVFMHDFELLEQDYLI